jgi:bisphosphoglycerate-dependent phosphoglycerate mutase family 1
MDQNGEVYGMGRSGFGQGGYFGDGACRSVSLWSDCDLQDVYPCSRYLELLNHQHCPIQTNNSLLLSEGYEPDIVFTSRLKRAVKSTWTILNALNAPYLPVYKSWRLNERNYGALTGLKKMDAAKELGMGVVQAWRNSLKARPPSMKVGDEFYPGKDRRYEDLGEEGIPLTESLMDCMERGERNGLATLL